jgi:hypothetical protein
MGNLIVELNVEESRVVTKQAHLTGDSRERELLILSAVMILGKLFELSTGGVNMSWGTTQKGE